MHSLNVSENFFLVPIWMGSVNFSVYDYIIVVIFDGNVVNTIRYIDCNSIASVSLSDDHILYIAQTIDLHRIVAFFLLICLKMMTFAIETSHAIHFSHQIQSMEYTHWTEMNNKLCNVL